MSPPEVPEIKKQSRVTLVLKIEKYTLQLLLVKFGVDPQGRPDCPQDVGVRNDTLLARGCGGNIIYWPRPKD